MTIRTTGAVLLVAALSAGGSAVAGATHVSADGPSASSTPTQPVGSTWG